MDSVPLGSGAAIGGDHDAHANRSTSELKRVRHAACQRSLPRELQRPAWNRIEAAEWLEFLHHALDDRALGRVKVLVAEDTAVWVGAKCHHSDGESSILRVVEAEPPREMTVVTAMPGVPAAYMTDRLTAIDATHTKWDCYWGWPEPEGGEAVSQGVLQFLNGWAPVLIGSMRETLAGMTGEASSPAAQ